jgi:hypothetical protein
LSTSVASKPAVRVESDSPVLAVREQRLPQLLDTVAAGALCASPAPGIPGQTEWHRGDGELADEWQARRASLVPVCAACPVQAACRESALRQGEGDGDPREINDFVRGGLTGLELYTARIEQADRLAAAAKEDARACLEERMLRALALSLRRQLLAHDQPHNAAKHNSEVRDTVAQITSVRAARRARTGWTSAA